MKSSKYSNQPTERYDKRVKIFILNNILSKLPDCTESLKTHFKTNGVM